MNKQKKYTYIHTHGHGYLSVSIKEIKRLNLTDKVSTCSKIDLSRVYLEEDCDMALFLDAKKSLGEDYEIKNSYRDIPRFLCGGEYKPHYIKYPIQIGSIVTNNDYQYSVIDINKEIVIKNEICRFYVSKSNPYKYLEPKIN